jgi:hypothetical protein
LVQANTYKQVLLLILISLGLQVLGQHVWLLFKATSGINSQLLIIRLLNLPFILTALSLILINNKFRFKPQLKVIILLLFFTTSFSLVMAIILRHDIRYITSDIIRMFIPWIVIIITYEALSNLQTKKDINNFIQGIIFIAFMDGVITICFALGIQNIRISADFFLLIFGLVVANLANKINGRALITFLFTIICIAATGKRAVMIGALIIILTTLYVRGPLNKRLFPALVVLITVVTAASFSQVVNEIPRIMFFLKQANSLSSVSDDASILGRIYELQNIYISYQYLPNIIAWIGQGYGAEVEMEYYTGVLSKNGMMHHAHSGVLVYFWRHGLFGLFLMLYLWISVVIFLKAYRRVALQYRTVYLAILSYTIYGIALSFKGNYMLEDITFPTLFALALFLSQYKVINNVQNN